MTSVARASVLGFTLFTGCTNSGLELGEPFVPEARGPLAVEARLRDSNRPLEGLEVIFVGPDGLESARTSSTGRARSSGAATDVHVFRGQQARSVLGAPAEVQVVFPESVEARSTGVLVRGRVRADDRVIAARLVAISPEVELDGWSGGSADPSAGGLPTHLPRAKEGEAEYRVVVGPRARGIAALLFGEAPDPIAVAIAELPAALAGTPVDLPPLQALPGRSDIVSNLPLPAEFPELSLYAELDTVAGRLRVEGGRRESSGQLSFRCPARPCAPAIELRRREDLGDARGLVVEARSSRQLADPAQALLPRPEPFLRSGRWLTLPRGRETAVVVTLRAAGSWHIALLDPRDEVELPWPTGPDPLDSAGPRLQTRVDLDRLPSSVETDEGWQSEAGRTATLRWLE